MKDKVFARIQRFSMIHSGDTVLVALSGGADSVALFHFLLSSCKDLGCTLGAAHFEHGLRGEESRRDADFVQALCEKSKVPLYTASGNMSGREMPHHTGVEAFARQLRYAFFDALAKEHDAKIATAHTLSDNAETVLFRAARGAGPRGLAGIPPVRGAFIRPLLDVSRDEVETYCKVHNLAYVTDSTNLSDEYTRNRLRKQVLPVLEQVRPGAAVALGRMAGDMRQLNDWLTQQAQELILAAKEQDNASGCTVYSAKILHKAPPPVRLQALSLLAGPCVDRAALARLELLLTKEQGGVQLSGNCVARVHAGGLVFTEPADINRVAEWEIPFRLGEILLPGGYNLAVSVKKNTRGHGADKKTEQKGYLFAADYAKMYECSVFRTRKQGDRYAPSGRNGSKTLKKWMNEQGIDPALRSSLPLLAAGQKVLWVWGAGFCDSLRPTGSTKQLLVLQTAENTKDKPNT